MTDAIVLLLEAPANCRANEDNRVLEFVVDVDGDRFMIKRVRNARTLEEIRDLDVLPPPDAVRTALGMHAWATQNADYFDPHPLEAGNEAIVEDDYFTPVEDDHLTPEDPWGFKLGD